MGAWDGHLAPHLAIVVGTHIGHRVGLGAPGPRGALGILGAGFLTVSRRLSPGCYNLMKTTCRNSDYLIFRPTNILFLIVPLMKGLPVSMF